MQNPAPNPQPQAPPQAQALAQVEAQVRPQPPPHAQPALSNSEDLLANVLLHLPRVQVNPSLAPLISHAIVKSSRTQNVKVFAIPLLPALTAVTLTSPKSQLLTLVNAIVSLTQSLVTRRAASHVTSYLVELVSVVISLLGRRESGPLPFRLPSFPESSIKSLPVTSNVVHAALVLLSAHLPSTLPLSNSANSDADTRPKVEGSSPSKINGNPRRDISKDVSRRNSSNADGNGHAKKNKSNPCCSASAPAVRLWHSIGSGARNKLLSLPARYELLAGTCGKQVAIASACLLLRAFDSASVVSLPSPLCDRIAHVAADAIPYAPDPALLFRVVALARPNHHLPNDLWAAHATSFALADGPVGKVLRSLSRSGHVDFFVNTDTSPNMLPPLKSLSSTRPLKWERVEPSDSPAPLAPESLSPMRLLKRQRVEPSDSPAPLAPESLSPMRLLKRQLVEPSDSPAPLAPESLSPMRLLKRQRVEPSDSPAPLAPSSLLSVERKKSDDSSQVSSLPLSLSQTGKPPSVMPPDSRKNVSVLALERKFATLVSVQQCVGNAASIELLSFAADISADALLSFSAASSLSVDCADISEWRTFVSSLAHILRDVARSLPAAPDPGMWPVFLKMALACLRLDSALRAIGDPVHGLSQRVFQDGATEACGALQETIIAIFLRACHVFKSHVDSFPRLTFARVLTAISNASFQDSFCLTDRAALTDSVNSIASFVLESVSSFGTVCGPRLVHAAFLIRHAVVSLDKTIESPSFISRLCNTATQYLNENAAVSAAAVYALGNELCVGVQCRISHCKVDRSNVKAFLSISIIRDADEWNSIFDIVMGLAHHDSIAVVNSAVHCLSALAVHASGKRRADCVAVLLDLLWRSDEREIVSAVLPHLSHLLILEDEERNARLRSNVVVIDGPEETYEETEVPIAKALASRLSSHVSDLMQISAKDDISLVDLKAFNSRVTMLYLALPFPEPILREVSAIACNALLTFISAEFNTLKSFSWPVASSVSDNHSSDQKKSKPSLQAWNEVVMMATHLHDESNGTGSHPSRNFCHFRFLGDSPDSAPWMISSANAVANLFSSRMGDWLPLSLKRMLRNDFFVSSVCTVIAERDVKTLWTKIPRFAVTSLLEQEDTTSLEALAFKLQISVKCVVEKTVADSLALSISESVNISENVIIPAMLEKSMDEIIRSKAGKVVQKLVMGLGGDGEEKAKAALVQFSGILRMSRSVGSDNDSIAGGLVACHFMLVMDAVNRRLFQSKATEVEQLRHLRMLNSIISLSKGQIHAFVPKILATLKLALDTFQHNACVCTQTLYVWTSFLNTLGSERIVVHIASILAIILPFFDRFENGLIVTLTSLIEKNASERYSDRSLVVLLLRMVNQPVLNKTATILEKGGQLNSATPASAESSEQDALKVSVKELRDIGHDVGRVIAQHESGTVEVIAARHFLRVLRLNREKINDVAHNRGMYHGDEPSEKGRCLASLLGTLVELLHRTRNRECRLVVMQCIGEVGAIDPAIVSQNAVIGVEEGKKGRAIKTQEYPTSIHALVTLLLNDYLVPTLAQGEYHSGSTSRLNRIGLVIQELLRACGCQKNTATRASKSVGARKDSDGPVRWDRVLVGETKEENAIYFWENLPTSTREIIEPYLAEPFDVQNYKGVFGVNSAGDVRLARQPVWAKVKAAASAGVVANAQEWRRQFVVQLVDFIGKKTMFGEMLRALRPILRYEDTVTAFIFPLVVVTALDIQKGKRSNELQNFVISEVCDVSKAATSSQVIFDLFDILRDWREIRCMVQGRTLFEEKYGLSSGSGTTVSASRRKALTPILVEAAKDDDPVSAFVDLDHRAVPSLSLLTQAKCAFRDRSYSRAILLAENHFRNVRKKKGLESWPSSLDIVLGKVSTENLKNDEEAEACSILQKSFAELEDEDSMRGIMALRSSSSLAETVIDTEVSGRFNEALITYERAIAENPRSVQFHCGFLRCLMTLGHWETMLLHAEGLSHSAKLDEMELRRSAEANGIEAAWRLGRWSTIDKFDCVSTYRGNDGTSVESDTSWSSNFTRSFGEMLLALQRRDADGLSKAAKAARDHLALPMVRAAREGYSRAYPMIIRLHSIADVEDSFYGLSDHYNEDSDLSTRRDLDDVRNLSRLISLRSRTGTTGTSLKVREPVLSTKRVCLEQLGMHNEAARVNLELAHLAKEGDNLRSAAASAFRALSTKCNDEDVKNASVIETAHIQKAQGVSSDALLVVKKEIDRLECLLGHQKKEKKGDVVMSATRDRLCTALVLAGSWIEESRSEPSNVVCNYFIDASSLGPSREEPFYALGKHYDSLLQASVNADVDLSLPGDSLSQGRTPRRTASPTETRAPEHYSTYVPLVIKSYARTLSNGHSRIFEALPRLLTVWFDYYTGLDDGKKGWQGMNIEKQVKEAMRHAFESIPMYMWMTAIPQLMSRILHNRKAVRDELSNILARIVAAFPDESFWTIVPSTQLKSSTQRKKATSDILNRAVSLKKGKGTAAKERARIFRNQLYNALIVMTSFVNICESPGAKEKRGRVENCSREFKQLRSHLRSSTSASPIIPTLKSLTVRLPIGGTAKEEHRPFDQEVVRIEGIDDNVLVMSSLMCPRRIALIGSDGLQYRYLSKKENNGDMRRDSRVVEFLTVMNRLLSKDAASRGKELYLKTYAVLPLTEETGMIEWVNDLCPFRTLVVNEHARIENVPTQMMIKQKYDTMGDKRKFLVDWAFEKFPPVLDRFFVKKFGGGDAQTWLTARNEWTKSCAVWSISGYIVGLGDRHGENVLMETTSGRCVHVDFAMLFDKGLKLRVPEVVPFRLTVNMVSAMGVAGYEGVFRTVCEIVMNIVRRHGDALLSRLESFLYDPLADWAGSETHGAKAGVMATKEAWQARAAVKAKLGGMVDRSGLALSIEGQVERLIRQATSVDSLSKMYIWWGPWI